MIAYVRKEHGIGIFRNTPLSLVEGFQEIMFGEKMRGCICDKIYFSIKQVNQFRLTASERKDV